MNYKGLLFQDVNTLPSRHLIKMMASFTGNFLLFLTIGGCYTYHLSMSGDKTKAGSVLFGRNRVTDFDSSSFELKISTRSEEYEIYESEDLFEGDILNVDFDRLFGLSGVGRASQGVSVKKWDKGVVPYEISPDFDTEANNLILKAIDKFHENTCLEFVARRKEESDYLFIQPGNGGCSSSVGRQSGKQVVNLGKGCLVIGTVQHELMHAIGFWHEQSRPDRDEFIKIQWENIQSGKEVNFLKHSLNILDVLSLSYDVGSLMHYGPFAFAKDSKKPTIVAVKEEDLNRMGQRKEFSLVDVDKINKMYECNNLV